MYEIARLPAGVVFLALLIPSLFTWTDWRIATLGWAVLLGWYLLIRWTLSESKDYIRHPVYFLMATISFFSVPVLGVIGLILGDSEMERFATSYEPYILPVTTLAVLFVFYSAWTAAKALVICEESGASDRAVRWERTARTFLALWIWPIGVWWVQKRVIAAAD
jgi:uncharacterized membrane protein